MNDQNPFDRFLGSDEFGKQLGDMDDSRKQRDDAARRAAHGLLLQRLVEEGVPSEVIAGTWVPLVLRFRRWMRQQGYDHLSETDRRQAIANWDYRPYL
jgi:hypothetical protein